MGVRWVRYGGEMGREWARLVGNEWGEMDREWVRLVENEWSEMGRALG